MTTEEALDEAARFARTAAALYRLQGGTRKDERRAARAAQISIAFAAFAAANRNR